MAAMFAAISFAYYLLPAWMSYSPKCLVKRLLGVNCPSCGAQRAVSLLLHGRWAEAVAMCPFLFFVACCLLLHVVLSSLPRRPLAALPLYAAMLGYLLFFIINNMPSP